MHVTFMKRSNMKYHFWGMLSKTSILLRLKYHLRFSNSYFVLTYFISINGFVSLFVFGVWVKMRNIVFVRIWGTCWSICKCSSTVCRHHGDLSFLLSCGLFFGPYIFYLGSKSKCKEIHVRPMLVKKIHKFEYFTAFWSFPSWINADFLTKMDIKFEDK